MKKYISMLVAVFMLASVMTGCSAAEPQQSDMIITMQIENPVMTVNGEKKEIDPGRGTAPVIKNGRTLLPIRAVIEEMSGAAAWDEETQTVVLAMDNDIIVLAIGDSTAFINEEQKALDVPPVLENGRTLLPIRFIAEGFHFTVSWDEKTQTVEVKK